MKYPKVHFLLNQDLDRWVAGEFKIGTVDEVKNFYASHVGELNSFNENAEENWNRVSSLFFDAVSRLFNQHAWPEGKYIGYASMFDCNPRFLNNKTFQVYYKHRAGSNYVVAHELLHFIFYDYAIKKHPDLFGDKDTESGIFWNVAEVFNSVVLHSSLFLPVHNAKETITYPEHTALIKHLEEVWNQNQS